MIPGREIVKVSICEVCDECNKEFVSAKKVSGTWGGVKMNCCEMCASGLENEVEGD